MCIDTWGDISYCPIIIYHINRLSFRDDILTFFLIGVEYTLNMYERKKRLRCRPHIKVFNTKNFFENGNQVYLLKSL